jgi:tetratricopeptide (TPR) repeat protein
MLNPLRITISTSVAAAFLATLWGRMSTQKARSCQIFALHSLRNFWLFGLGAMKPRTALTAAFLALAVTIAHAGLTKDVAEAVTWYRKATANGDVETQKNVSRQGMQNQCNQLGASNKNAESEKSVRSGVAMLNEMATDLYKRGDYQNALQVAKKSLESSECNLAPDDPQVTIPRKILEDIYRTQRSNEAAESSYKRSPSISENTFGPYKSNEIAPPGDLAEVYVETHKDNGNQLPIAAIVVGFLYWAFCIFMSNLIYNDALKNHIGPNPRAGAESNKKTGMNPGEIASLALWLGIFGILEYYRTRTQKIAIAADYPCDENGRDFYNIALGLFIMTLPAFVIMGSI